MLLLLFLDRIGLEGFVVSKNVSSVLLKYIVCPVFNVFLSALYYLFRSHELKFVRMLKVANRFAKLKHFLVRLQEINFLVHIQVLGAQQQLTLSFEKISKIRQKVVYFTVMTVSFD